MGDLWTLPVIISYDRHGDSAESGAAIHPRRRHNVYGHQVAADRGQQPISIDVSHLRWQQDAACRGMDRELFFDPKTPADILRNVCADCPVRAQCLAYAEEHRLLGVWGGTTEEERGVGKWRRRPKASV